MNNKILSIALAACMAGTLSSCDDFLTPSNKSNVTDDQYFSQKSGFETLVNNSYEHLRDIYTNKAFCTWFEAGTDMYISARTNISDPYQKYETLDAEDGDNKTLYFDCYTGIRHANAVKAYAAKASLLDKAYLDKRVDEARVIAAHYYYLLVNCYGGVPLMKTFVETASTGYPRSTTEETYDYIISELESVVANNNLEASTAANGGGRVSMESAKGLLAQVYLSAAWDLNKKEYFAKAADMADQVIRNRALTTSFADLWKADGSGDDNEEFIWDVEYDHATANNKVNGGNSWSTWYSNYLGGNEDDIKATSSEFVPSLYALHCFEKGDQRYDATFMKELPMVAKGNSAHTGYWTWYKNGESLKGYPVQRYYRAWYETDADVEAWRALDPDNRKDTYVIPMDTTTVECEQMNGAVKTYEEMVKQVFGGSVCRKFDDASTAAKVGSTDYRDIHIMTLSEMYLVAAEAYFKAGDITKALARLNMVRHRAGLADAQTIDIDAILKERACEMFGNSLRWIDLRRTQTLIEHNNLHNPDIAGEAALRIGKKLLRPIPQAAIDANNLLTSDDQNEGYK